MLMRDTRAPRAHHVPTSMIQTTRKTLERFIEVEAYRLAASMSYYALFSVFPLLLMATAVFGFILGHSDETRERVLDLIQSDQPAVRSLIDQTLRSMQENSGARGVSAVVGGLSLLVGASGVFTEFFVSVERIFRVKEKPSKNFAASALDTLRLRALAVVCAIFVALLLFVTFLGSAMFEVIERHAPSMVMFPILFRIADFCASLALLSLAFGTLFRTMPSCHIAWRDALAGGAVSAILVSLVRWVLAHLLAKFTSYAAYGAAGSVLALATWIYLSILCFLLGAQVTEVLSTSHTPPPPTQTAPNNGVATGHPQ